MRLTVKTVLIKIIVFIMLSVNIYSFAPSVVVQMLQHDVERDVERESTFLLENGVLDVMFDAGYIVSSLPITINKDVDSTLKETISVAKAGYMSYVVYVNVYYRDYGFTGDETISIEDIESVDWEIVSTKDYSVLSSGQMENIQKMAGENDLIAMKRFSNDLGIEIKREFDKKL